MTINPYFNNYTHGGQQRLIESLIIESIKMYGLDCYYIPRVITAEEEIYREGELVEFQQALPIELYIKGTSGWGGDGKFLSKFGLEIRDEMTFTIAKKRWTDAVNTSPRPNEGDLIFFPLNNKCFQINFVNHEAIFYQMGTLQTYDLQCELFEFNGEVFNTGVSAIDDLYASSVFDMDEYSLVTEDGNFVLTTEAGGVLVADYDIEDIDEESQNNLIQREADELADWSELDPFSEKGRY